jgi:hypothetical protein
MSWLDTNQQRHVLFTWAHQILTFSTLISLKKCLEKSTENRSQAMQAIIFDNPEKTCAVMLFTQLYVLESHSLVLPKLVSNSQSAISTVCWRRGTTLNVSELAHQVSYLFHWFSIDTDSDWIIYLTAVLKYLAAEILELTGTVAMLPTITRSIVLSLSTYDLPSKMTKSITPLWGGLRSA